MYKLTSLFPRDQADPCNLLDPSMESDMDLDLMEMFTSNLLAEDDTHNNNDTITLAVESHSLNTPPLVDLSDDTEPHHQVVDLFGDLEPGDQETAQELAAPSTTPAPSPPPTLPIIHTLCFVSLSNIQLV